MLLRSIVVPGWGQWENGKRTKAVLVGIGEGVLIYRAIAWAHLEQRSKDRAKAEPERAEEFLREADRNAAHRRDFTWWSVFAIGLSMGDAYVDATLGDVDAEFETKDWTAARWRNRGAETTTRPVAEWRGGELRLGLRHVWP